MRDLRDARLALASARGQVLANGLDLLGVSAPENDVSGSKDAASRRRERNGGQRQPPPGCGWCIGLVLGVVLIVGVPKLMPKGDGDGFFRPQPNPDAQPVATTSAEDDDAIVPEDAQPGRQAQRDRQARRTTHVRLLHAAAGRTKCALSDAELARPRAPKTRAQAAAATQQPRAGRRSDAADVRAADAVRRQRRRTRRDTPAAGHRGRVGTDATPKDDGTRYLLQAGAFQASGDAEAVKAKIALLGLSARVESAQIADKTVYRVRMGPYGTASANSPTPSAARRRRPAGAGDQGALTASRGA